MKKLNKKGFTLIELLAVIVILAIIVVVTVPTILNSINDARLSSIHSLSKEVANWYDTSSAQDMMALDPNTKILKGIELTETSSGNSNWICLKDASKTDTKGTASTADDVTYTLAGLYGLSGNDVKLDGEVTNIPYTIPDKEMVVKDKNICSAIRINNGRAEVLIVANPDGKFNTNGYTYAYSALGNGSEGK